MSTVRTLRAAPLLDNLNGNGLGSSDLRAAWPVRGASGWETYGQAICWALSRGGVLVNAGPSGLVGVGSSATWRFYTWPRIPIVARLWCIGVSMRSTSVSLYRASGSFEIPDGDTPKVWAIDSSSRGRVENLRFIQSLTATDAPAEVQITMNVNAGSGGSVYVESIACYELPRATLIEFGDGPQPAPDPTSCGSGRLISEGNALGNSVDGLMRTVMDPLATYAQIRRSCYFSDYRPAGQSVTTTETALFTNPIYVLPRVNTIDEDTSLVKVAVYGSGPSGSVARVYGGVVDPVEIALPTSNGWAFGDVEIGNETPESWDTNGGSDSGASLEVYGEAASSTATIYGVCMGDPPP